MAFKAVSPSMMTLSLKAVSSVFAQLAVLVMPLGNWIPLCTFYRFVLDPLGSIKKNLALCHTMLGIRHLKGYQNSPSSSPTPPKSFLLQAKYSKLYIPSAVSYLCPGSPLVSGKFCFFICLLLQYLKPWPTTPGYIQWCHLCQPFTVLSVSSVFGRIGWNVSWSSISHQRPHKLFLCSPLLVPFIFLGSGRSR